MTADSPFTPAYSRQSFLETPGRGDVLRRLDEGLGSREPFLLLTGGPGIGKTALACEAVARWDARVTAAYLAYPALAGAEFLEEIIRRFGAEPPDGASRSKLVACIEQALAEIAGRGQVAMVVVDDAHALSPEPLEELRLLVNAAQQAHWPLEVLLIGLPALEATLDDPALAALRQRVSVHARLEPLSAAETRRYLHHRITVVGGDGPGLFSRKTCRDIAARTGGVPRQINALAAEALRVARAWGDQTVGAEHVQTAAAALGGFVPTGDVADSTDAGAEDSPAPTAPPHAPATAKAPAIAPAAAASVAPASAPDLQPSPKAQPAARAPARSTTAAKAGAEAGKASAARTEEGDKPHPPSAANQDPHEWVARFVGDKGPLQISSRALPETRWADAPSEASGAQPPSPAEKRPTPRGRQEHARPRSRSRYRGSLRVALPAALATIVVVTTVALVMRAGGLARSRGDKVAAGATGASQVADQGTSSEQGASSKDRAADSRAGAAPPPAPVEEPRQDRPTTKSRGPFTLDVGGYRDLEDAFDQRNRMEELTGFQGWVVPAPEGRGYRIVLNAYRSYARATSAANMLLRSKTLRNVTVVPLPPKSQRR
ncbi:MAG: hypothetical protein A2W00_01260 [Candidatus Eisenbacteria bacterium RBG_16_71_46]|nr:MAG: hypothetical protein A2W00_01260 [Candidatus Eisenbacteria bacterium RBG_16_71_46]